MSERWRCPNCKIGMEEPYEYCGLCGKKLVMVPAKPEPCGMCLGEKRVIVDMGEGIGYEEEPCPACGGKP